MSGDGERFGILFVCTANRCRSPLAETIARDAIRRRNIDASVSSAGLMAGGHRAASGAQKAARELGLDLSDHVSRRITESMIDAADVVVTMQASHVLDLTSSTPGCRARTLTLRELAASAHSDHDRGAPVTLDVLRERIRVAADRPLEALLSGDVDVEDPIGRSNRAFRQTARELTRLIDLVVDDWFGPTPAADASRRPPATQRWPRRGITG